MSYRNETWPIKEDNFIRLVRNDAQMFRWRSNFRLEDGFLYRNLRTECIEYHYGLFTKQNINIV